VYSHKPELGRDDADLESNCAGEGWYGSECRGDKHEHQFWDNSSFFTSRPAARYIHVNWHESTFLGLGKRSGGKSAPHSPPHSPHSKPLLPPHLPIIHPSPAQGNSRVSFARLCFKFHRHCSLDRYGRPEVLNLVSGGTQAILSLTLRWSLLPNITRSQYKRLDLPPHPSSSFPIAVDFLGHTLFLKSYVCPLIHPDLYFSVRLL
jgi:hypothetical protein